MHNTESVVENETHKVLLDFVIQTDQLNLARQSDILIVNQKKRTCRIVDFTVPTVHRVTLKKKEKRKKYLHFARELTNTIEHENDGDTSCYWCTWNNPEKIGEGTPKRRNKRKSGNYPDYSIIKIGQNSEKGPWDFRRLAGFQTPARNHQLTLVWKTQMTIAIIKIIIIIIIII